jgi:voltage-gated potassium channel
MSNDIQHSRHAFFRSPFTQFWSGNLGLSLITISIVLQIFVVTPLRETAVGGRLLLDLLMFVLMVAGALVVEKRRRTAVLIVATVLLSAVFLTVARVRPTPFHREIASVSATVTLLLYARVVLLITFRGGPVTWSRVQGGICAYLLFGMAWASVYGVLEQVAPGSFQFMSSPADVDQMTSKLTYFSFGALTTAGSDIHPISSIARYMCVAESVFGQLFPLILIGALVAMAMQSQKVP